MIQSNTFREHQFVIVLPFQYDEPRGVLEYRTFFFFFKKFRNRTSLWGKEDPKTRKRLFFSRPPRLFFSRPPAFLAHGIIRL